MREQLLHPPPFHIFRVVIIDRPVRLRGVLVKLDMWPLDSYWEDLDPPNLRHKHKRVKVQREVEFQVAAWQQVLNVVAEFRVPARAIESFVVSCGIWNTNRPDNPVSWVHLPVPPRDSTSRHPYFDWQGEVEWPPWVGCRMGRHWRWDHSYEICSFTICV